ncbi:MAG: hypothetical protein NTW28_23875 [Candidatus Solibacter sp.]|nr:hypothetical protein [Candidatus Solibacter sp.]
MPKFGLSAVLSAILMFFSGAVLGAFSYRLYSISPVQSGKDAGAPPKKLSPDEFRKKYVSDLASAVKLDSQQILALNGVLDRTRAEFDKLNDKIKPERDALNEKRDALNEKWRPDREAIQSHQVESINGLLRPDQRPLYEAFRTERERLRRLHDQQRKKQ